MGFGDKSKKEKNAEKAADETKSKKEKREDQK
jgi:hypothetical protein